MWNVIHCSFQQLFIKKLASKCLIKFAFWCYWCNLDSQCTASDFFSSVGQVTGENSLSSNSDSGSKKKSDKHLNGTLNFLMLITQYETTHFSFSKVHLSDVSYEILRTQVGEVRIMQQQCRYWLHYSCPNPEVLKTSTGPANQ